MATTEELLAQAKRDLLPNYRQPDFVLVKGSGVRVEDAAGRQFLDLSGGIAVLSVGHAHPRLAAAIGTQAARLMHCSNLFYNDRAIELATALVERTAFDRAFFCNSGTEANEALIKLARRWHHEQGHGERVGIVSAYDSFHGRTMGALSITGQPKYHVGMGPLVPECAYVPFNDIGALDKAIDQRTAAVVLEPIQGEGGIVIPDDAYLRQARELCDARGALLLFDEVQTGCGRTGKFLGHEWSGVVPDGCSLAKGIGGGFPLGVVLVRERLAGAFPPGAHATTFGGNPLACAAGLAVLSIIDEEKLLDNTMRVGEHLQHRLQALSAHSAVLEARGRGLLQGVLLADWVEPLAVLGELREEGLLATIAGGRVLRLAPPLNVTLAELDEGLAIMDRVLAAMSKEAMSKEAMSKEAMSKETSA